MKPKSNMYNWVSSSRNFLAGKCQYNCVYCYVNNLKRFPQIKKKYSGKFRLIESEFKKPLGKGKTIFIGSCIDIFSPKVNRQDILRILNYCKDHNNLYLFQTKNPERFKEFLSFFPPRVILGVTIESNRIYEKLTKAPFPYDRMLAMKEIKLNKFVSIEPIMDFDLKEFVNMIREIKPDFVSIGADSKNNGLNEPSKEKSYELIKELKRFTVVKIKSNLKRLR